MTKRNRETRHDCTMCGGNSFKKNLCIKHHQFSQMRYAAKKCKKYVPSYDELEKIFNSEMLCEICEKKMVWRRSEDAKLVMSLQHYRSGAIGLICMNCNVKHASMEGDTFCDMPKGCKYCPSCRKTKFIYEFYTNGKNKNGEFKTCSKCKLCHVAFAIECHKKNRKYLTEKQLRAARERKRTGGAGMSEISCAVCSERFFKKTVLINETNGIFCSKSCKAVMQHRLRKESRQKGEKYWTCKKQPIYGTDQ